ncbi:MAG: hypothetical protein KGH64_02600 [Candidatus Micrarchaeota archaeon]|nr:hypothetical protein [Candidatus Micrarchaeota archaeon]MDE1834202.1 hypothetical protein [Candidatus Micrarchaeota archaeon]MDE1859082.1 hypothetical protein [Candidatus Micrarchaeota archaeon]
MLVLFAIARNPSGWWFILFFLIPAAVLFVIIKLVNRSTTGTTLKVYPKGFKRLQLDTGEKLLSEWQHYSDMPIYITNKRVIYSFSDRSGTWTCAINLKKISKIEIDEGPGLFGKFKRSNLRIIPNDSGDLKDIGGSHLLAPDIEHPCLVYEDNDTVRNAKAALEKAISSS